jgi:hypothetical protein
MSWREDASFGVVRCHRIHMRDNIVPTTATALSLTAQAHAGRTVLINTNSTVANTFTLPATTGSGNVYTLINNIAQTQGTVVVAAYSTDVMSGIAMNFGTTEETAMAFRTSATSDKVTLDLTTTGGGVGGDKIVCKDVAEGTWLVECVLMGSGSLATPFSETS